MSIEVSPPIPLPPYHEVYTDENGIIRIALSPFFDLYDAPAVKQKTLDELSQSQIAGIDANLFWSYNLDSAALGYFIELYKIARTKELDLQFSVVSREAYKMFELVGLTRIFQIGAVAVKHIRYEDIEGKFLSPSNPHIK